MATGRLAILPAPEDWDPNDARLWRVQDCAEFLGKTAFAVRHMVAKGTIPHVRFGRSVRFIPSRVHAWVRSMEVAS